MPRQRVARKDTNSFEMRKIKRCLATGGSPTIAQHSQLFNTFVNAGFPPIPIMDTDEQVIIRYGKETHSCCNGRLFH